MKNNEVIKKVVDRIIEKIENENILPWATPWKGLNAHSNYVSKKAYRGINTLILAMEGRECPYWLTFKQCQDKGGKVLKGSTSTPVFYWNTIQVKEKDSSGAALLDENGKQVTKKILVAKTFNVFNLEQTTLYEEWKKENDKSSDKIVPVTYDKAEALVNEYIAREGIKLTKGIDRACYIPSKDEIQVPAHCSFKSNELYYATLFHEVAHSTGAEKRLNRFGKDKSDKFSDKSYGIEELVAEITAAMTCAYTEIPVQIEQSASYLKSWLDAIKETPNMIIKAASASQKALDFICGINLTSEE